MTTPNNDKNVYILGAGFSKNAGLPLQDDFLVVAKEVFFSDTAKYKHFESVFKYQDTMTKMKKYLSYPLLNLEQLFNLIEMNMYYSEENEIHNIKNDFVRLIRDVLIYRTPIPFLHNSSGGMSINTIYNDYEKFLRLFYHNSNNSSATSQDSIISFNYDLILEAAASIHNNRIISDINRGQINRRKIIKFNQMKKDSDVKTDAIGDFFKKNSRVTYNPDIQFGNDQDCITFIKLHGSINWTLSSDDSTFIIPPTWNKSDPRVKALWNCAYKELIEAKRIIVIGYSFPDTDVYVKSLLALAINENKILQNIIFVNPDVNTTKRNSIAMLDNYFERYCSYAPWTFSELMNSSDGRKFIQTKLNRDIF